MKDKHMPQNRSVRSIRVMGGFRDLTDSNPRIAYSSHPDATGVTEAEASAAVYAIVLNLHKRKGAAYVADGRKDGEA